MNDRQAHVAPGPAFERAPDGAVMFKFVIDGGSVIGPRLASEKDQAEHIGPWREFLAREGLPAQDRNGDGTSGGRLPSDEKVAVIAELEGLRVTFDKRLGLARLRAILADHKAGVAAPAEGGNDEPADDNPGGH